MPGFILLSLGITTLEKWEEISWQQFYNICFAFYSLKAEVSYMLGKFDTADAIYPYLLDRAHSKTDKCSVYLIMSYQYELQVPLGTTNRSGVWEWWASSFCR